MEWVALDKDRTKRDVLRALIELSNKTPFEKISVTEICKKAHLSRQTFYQHFRDKYDVAYYLSQVVVEDNFQQLGKSVGWHTAYLRTFKRMEEYSGALKHLSKSDDYNSLINCTIRNCEQDFINRYRDRFGADPDALLRFQMHWFAHLGTLVPTEWIESGCEPSAEQFVQYFLSLIPKELFEALDLSLQSEEVCQES